MPDAIARLRAKGYQPAPAPIEVAKRPGDRIIHRGLAYTIRPNGSWEPDAPTPRPEPTRFDREMKRLDPLLALAWVVVAGVLVALWVMS